MKKIFFLLFFAIIFSELQAQVEWRYDRTGVYREVDLLEVWPAGGPLLLWQKDGLGQGFSSVAIVDDQVFTTGYHDGKGFLYELDLNGKSIRSVEYGREYDNSYPGARSTVIPSDGRLYVASGMAELYCYDEKTLTLLWKKNYITDYGAENTRHGWNGPPLIVGNLLIVAPGGAKHHVVALDKVTGNMIWSTPGAESSDMAGYGTPVYIDDVAVKQVVVMMAKNIVGIDVAGGKLLWHFPHTNRFGEHPNTPVYSNGRLLCTSSYGKGSVMLRLTDGGRKVEKVWSGTELGHQTGHVMKWGDYVYGCGEKMNWHCVDWLTGKVMWSSRALSIGNVIAADGMLYCYSDKGEMALVKPDPKKFDIVSRFEIPGGTGQHWAHPVIYRKILYIRHGDSLMAFQIRR